MRYKIIILFILAFLCLAAKSHKPTLAIPATLVNAIHQVEAQGKMENVAAGDNGLAVGPLQIHRVCWQDAVEYDKSIGGTYEDCKSYSYSVKIFTAYLNRYGKQFIQTNNYEYLSRIWNGGPNGYKKKATVGYWEKVKSHIINSEK